MRRSMSLFSASSLLFAGTLAAQEIAGTWQGTIKSELGTLRTVLEIGKSEDAGWKAVLYSIDQSGFDRGIPASTTTLRNSVVTILFAQTGGTFEGTVKPDANSIAGTWTQNGVHVPLLLVRATARRDGTTR